MNDFTDIVSKVMEVRPDDGDYTGEDGLLYCGKCHTPKEAYFEDGHAALFGRDRHPTNCACQQKRMDEKRLADQQRKHEDTVKELKKDCFDTPKLRDWCFSQDNGANPQMKHARFYADNFDKMLSENIGYLLWGSVGTGKSFFAACIANALMEKEIPVCMTNFAAVLNDLSGSFEGRNQYIARLCRYPLLILDDPFSALDRKTEQEIFKNLQKETENGIVLLISHRLYLFPKLSKVIWMEQGNTVVAPHEELLKVVPEYRSLFEDQEGAKDEV